MKLPLDSQLIRFSIFYFFISASVAVCLTFLPVFGNHLGLGAMELAILSAGLNIGTVFGSPLMAQLAHRYVAARKLVPCCLWLAFFLSLPIVWSHSFWTLYPYWQLLSLLAYGSSVVVDYHAIRRSLVGTMRFEHARLWGSVGFVVATVVLGKALDQVGIQSVPFVLAGISLCLALSGSNLAPLLSAAPAKNIQSALSGPAIHAGKQFYLLLATVALSWAAHSALYIYLSIHLRALGWSGGLISVAWSLGVFVEIVVFIFFKRWESCMPLRRILQLSLFLTAIRWVVLAYATSEWLILASQILHGFSFGSLYLASLRLVHIILPDDRRDRGQGMLSAATSGFGSLVGRMTIGMAASMLPIPEGIPALFLLSLIPTLLALIISLRITASDTPMHSDAGLFPPTENEL